MARRPDNREAEILKEGHLREIRHNLAHFEPASSAGFLREGLPGLPIDLQSHSKSKADSTLRWKQLWKGR